MDKRDVPDILSHMPKPKGSRPEGKSIYISGKSPIAHIISNIFH